MRTGDRRKVLRMEISFNLPYPLSVNTYWRYVGGRTVLSARGRQYRNLALGELLEQGVAGARISDRVPGIGRVVRLDCSDPGVQCNHNAGMR